MDKRRVAVERIESRSARNVCFSKRRKGLFSKAEQLSRMDPKVSVAAVVYSPAGTPYTYGDTSSVFGRYLAATSPSPSPANMNDISSILSVDVSSINDVDALRSYASDLHRLRRALLKALADRNRNEKFADESHSEADRSTLTEKAAFEEAEKKIEEEVDTQQAISGNMADVKEEKKEI